ncbi:MAG: shikimate dehydrogenase [Nonlabens sp.]
MEIPRSIFGLLGKRLDYSFSRSYFSQKFESVGLSDHEYRNYEIKDVGGLARFRESVIYNKQSRLTNGKKEILRGLNVTIPYKESIIEVLDSVSDEAQIIGAVNTITIEDNLWTGHNTDAYGFAKSLVPQLPIKGNALILGTGGASKAVAYALDALQIPHLYVSRSPGNEATIGYSQLDREVMESVGLIVNTTPLGTHPDVTGKPDIPYHLLGSHHLLYDLVYNPQQTLFMKLGLQRGCNVTNGYEMLVHQAERAWELWNQ